jgi:anaerobic selenocysteine-containing dehydrogenase
VERTISSICRGEGSHKLALGDTKPALDGRWPVTLVDGSRAWVRPLFQVLREHLAADYTPATQERTTGVKASVVEQFARGLANAPAAMIYASWGACKNYHSDLFQRAMALLMALSGNQGRKGGGLRVASWWELKGADELGGGNYRPPITEVLKLVAKGLRGLTPGDWEEVYTAYSAHYPITPLMPFLYHHGGYDEVWDAEAHQDPALPRSTAEYMKEAVDKGWIPIHPEPGTRPRVFIFSGSNPLRRWPSPQTAKKNFWPKLDLIVSTNFRMSTSTMWADIVLPVAAHYEKYGIKYGVSSMPYIVACEPATPPLGDSKADYEVFGAEGPPARPHEGLRRLVPGR